MLMWPPATWQSRGCGGKYFGQGSLSTHRHAERGIVHAVDDRELGAVAATHIEGILTDSGVKVVTGAVGASHTLPGPGACHQMPAQLRL
jgi:hypothetical protein